MNRVKRCPICNLTIEVRSEQFRADDEPATLVSMCPNHGTVGSLCMSYVASKDSSVITTCPRLRPSSEYESETFYIRSSDCQNFTDQENFFVVEVALDNPIVMELKLSSHIRLESPTRIDKHLGSCTRHFCHPLYNITLGHSDGTGIAVMVRETLGPLEIKTIRLVTGLSKTIELGELPLIESEWFEIVSRSSGSSICYRNKVLEGFKILAIANNKQDLIKLLQESYSIISNAQTFISNSTEVRAWVSKTRLMDIYSEDLVIFIDKDIPNGSEEGSYISAPGSPCLICLNGHLVTMLNLANRKCQFSTLVVAKQNILCNGVYKGYMSKHNVYIDYPVGIDYSSIEDVVLRYTNVKEVQRAYTANWRECTPFGIESVKVRPSTSGTLSDKTSPSSILMQLVCKTILGIIEELSLESIIIYGYPTSQFNALANKCKCTYVYPYDWDDNIVEVDMLGSVPLYHHESLAHSNNCHISNSFNLVMTDDGYKALGSKVLSIYLPSMQTDVISRNEFDMFIAIRKPGECIKPHNSIHLDILNTKVYRVFSMMHITCPEFVIYHHPSLGAYLELI